MLYTNNSFKSMLVFIVSYIPCLKCLAYSLHIAGVARDAIRLSGLRWRGQRSSSDQLLGNEEVFKSFHLPETDWQQDGGLHHGPPQHFAVGHLADLPELVLFLLHENEEHKTFMLYVLFFHEDIGMYGFCLIQWNWTAHGLWCSKCQKNNICVTHQQCLFQKSWPGSSR